MKNKIFSRTAFMFAAITSILLFSAALDLPDPFTVCIEKDAVLVNNSVISKDWKTSTIQQIFGRPDTVLGDQHPDACYDNYDIGIRYFQRRCNELGTYVEELKFFLAQETDEYSSGVHAPFDGMVSLCGTAIDSTTSYEKLKRILTGWRPCNAYSSSTTEFMTDTNYIFVEYSSDKQKLLWICVGKRTSLISGCD